MSSVVLDASSVLSWCFEDEGGPQADALIERVATGGALVPAIVPREEKSFASLSVLFFTGNYDTRPGRAALPSPIRSTRK